MLEDQETGKSGGIRRKLSFWSNPEKYRSIYYRCCGNPTDSSGTALDCNDSANENKCRSKNNPAWRKDGAEKAGYSGNCKCPVRGSSYVKKWWNPNNESYFTKWQDSCKSGGTIERKAEL